MDGALCVVRCVRTIASDVFLERRLNMWMNLSEEGAPASVEHQSVNLQSLKKSFAITTASYSRLVRLSFPTTVGVDAPARKVEQAVGGWIVLHCVLQHPFNVKRERRSNTLIHPLSWEANARVGNLYAMLLLNQKRFYVYLTGTITKLAIHSFRIIVVVDAPVIGKGAMDGELGVSHYALRREFNAMQERDSSTKTFLQKLEVTVLAELLCAKRLPL